MFKLHDAKCSYTALLGPLECSLNLEIKKQSVSSVISLPARTFEMIYNNRTFEYFMCRWIHILGQLPFTGKLEKHIIEGFLSKRRKNLTKDVKIIIIWDCQEDFISHIYFSKDPTPQVFKKYVVYN